MAKDIGQNSKKNVSRRSAHTAKKVAETTLSTSGVRPVSGTLTVTDAATMARKINFQSITKAEASLEELEFDEGMVVPVMTHVYRQSPARALKFAKAVIRRSITDESHPNHQEIRSLIQSGCGKAKGKAELRGTVCTAFRQSKLNLILVQGVAELKKADARAYIKGYFDAGGDLNTVLQWLELAGRVLRKQQLRTETDKRSVKAVGDLLEDMVDAATDMVATVVDAVKFAGKSMFDVLKSTAQWTMEQMTNLVHGLVEAGRSVREILTAAKRVGLATLRRLVQAVCNVHESVGQLVEWATKQTMDTIVSICTDIPKAFQKEFFHGLLKVGKSAVGILKAAVKVSLTVLAIAFAAFLEIWGGHRGLTTEEREHARKVFGWSIDLDRVKIAVASLPVDVIDFLKSLFDRSGPFTTMYIINFSSWTKVKMGTLIHELTHVWQSVVDGPVYMVEALYSQHFGRGYNVTKKDLVAARGDLKNLEREQQAVVVERYWQGRYNNGRWNWRVYEPFARQVFGPKQMQSDRRVNPIFWPEGPLVPGGAIP